MTDQKVDVLLDAQMKWGNRAIKHGLVIVSADDATIGVAPMRGRRPEFLISKEVLKSVRNLDWPFEEAVRRTRTEQDRA